MRGKPCGTDEKLAKTVPVTISGLFSSKSCCDLGGLNEIGQNLGIGTKGWVKKIAQEWKVWVEREISVAEKGEGFERSLVGDMRVSKIFEKLVA